MTRTASPIRNVPVQVQIPEHVLERVDNLLRSELDDRVPYGARSALVVDLLVQYLKVMETI
jgi:metal-responsive CopG/Arc/MetJ family transcriptional regulator